MELLLIWNFINRKNCNVLPIKKLQIFILTNYENKASDGTNATGTLDTTFYNGFYFIRDVNNDYLKKDALLRVMFIKPGDQFSQKDIDGGLIGGASLKAKSFVRVIASF